MTTRTATGTSERCRPSAFTLIELLTVIAIIALLIGILIPSLSKARDTAKRVKTQAIMKGIGNGLDLFGNENEDVLSGNAYPPSTAADDPTESGQNNKGTGDEELYGAQRVVRYLMGKDLKGYVARADVPKVVLDAGSPGWEEKDWYAEEDLGGYNVKFPLPRRGPYANDLEVKGLKLLPGFVGQDPNSPRNSNPVFTDPYSMPICYYAANSRYAERPDANPATYGRDPAKEYKGIFTFKDNAVFTGLCTAESCAPEYQPWDFGSGIDHKLHFGPTAWVGAKAPKWGDVVENDTESFVYFIMNKDAFKTTNKKSVIPHRRDSFLLLTPGKDGIFGTKDDVSNIQ